jgi:glycosyltransferase involved in cell wall biosynthesis
MVSIIIPYFNSAKFFAETLDSVLNQSIPDWECLLIDDGSSDESGSIVDEYVQKDTRFVSLKRENGQKGVSQCRNIGIEASKGDFLIFLDSDDLMDSNCLKHRVKFMDSEPELDFTVFQVETFGLEKNVMTNLKSDYMESFLRFDFAWTVSSPIWKAHFLKSLGGFNTDMTALEDPELHIRALQRSPKYKVEVDTDPDIFYRIWKESGKPDLSRLQSMLDGYFIYMRLVDEIIQEQDFSPELLSDGLMKTLKRLRWVDGVTISKFKEDLTYLVGRLPFDGIRKKMALNTLKSVTIEGKSKQNNRKEIELMMAVLFPGRYFRSYLKF